MCVPRNDTLGLSACGCHEMSHTTSLSMWLLRKNSHYVSLDVAAAEELTQRLSRCGCRGRTHRTSVLMFRASKRLALRVSRCRSHAGTHNTCLSMWMPRKYLRDVSIDVCLYISHFVFIHLATNSAYSTAVFLFSV